MPHEWYVRVSSGSLLRVKRWTEMVKGEIFFESTHLAAVGVVNALMASENETAARDLYADLINARHHHFSGVLDPRVWAQLRKAFEEAHFVIVPLHEDPSKYGWEAVSVDDRRVYVMRLLVETYGYPQNSAAGICGNLEWESGLLPDRIEGSTDTAPFRAPGFSPRGVRRDFTPAEIVNRNGATKTGPLFPGVGLAQWTYPPRRRALFRRKVGGVELGEDVLFNMDAQVEYLISEIRSWGGNLQAKLMAARTLEDASDVFTYQFEVPGTLLDSAGHKRPINDPQVQREFQNRRPLGRAALRAYVSARTNP